MLVVGCTTVLTIVIASEPQTRYLLLRYISTSLTYLNEGLGGGHWSNSGGIYTGKDHVPLLLIMMLNVGWPWPCCGWLDHQNLPNFTLISLFHPLYH